MLPYCYVVANLTSGEIIPHSFNKRETADKTATECRSKTGDSYTVLKIRNSVLVATQPIREVCSNTLNLRSK